MAVDINQRLITEEELLALGSEARVEIVEGEIVTMPPVGGLHHFIAGNIHDEVKSRARASQAGYVFMDGLIYLLQREGPGLHGARVPDVSYVHKTDIPAGWDIQRPFPGAPTLAVEVMSPQDDIEDVVRKVNEYLAAGSAEVWVVLPESRQVYRYQHGESQVTIYKGGDTLDASALLPGLRLALADIFAVPDLGSQDLGSQEEETS